MIISDFDFIDLRESLDGDLILANGDFADTSKEQELTYVQVIASMLKTEIGEHKAFPYFGFDFSSFMGGGNTQENAARLVSSIRQSIHDRTELYTNLFVVDAFPLSKTTIGLQVTVGDGQYIIAYDTMDGKTFMLSGLDDSFEDTSF
jgi:hypothetical protein